LIVDFPEDVEIPVEQNQMVTAEVVGSSIKFSYCELDRAIAYLVEVKIVRLSN
jgi:hypothetical protein